MKFNRKEIVAAFDAVEPGLSSRETVTQAQSFVFYDGRVYTDNDKIAVSHKMPEGWDITVAVKAQELHRVLKKFETEEVEIVARLKHLGYSVEATTVGKDRDLSLAIPSWRLWDCRNREDVVEDVAGHGRHRAYAGHGSHGSHTR
jgi:hypothetical protein